MTFRVNNLNYNLTDLARKLGYKPIAHTPQGELNCVRPLGGDYPRFHIYLKEEPGVLTFNIHLDQKKPSYEGTAAHGGDYESETVREEVERIKGIIYRSK
ncbi:hypothetical protein C4571_03590 [Candidatus Parcubacteria bacterium]|nr:MAG: hypothetical protein C4571_03590 [Candidatus Parcubacteria bacterium]